MTGLDVPDSPKAIRETLCIAQSAIAQRTHDLHRRQADVDLLQRLIDACDRHRPLGSDGKHGERHTATCGCEGPGWSDRTCAACGRPVRVWERISPRPVRLILDPEPTDDGDVMIRLDGTPQGVHNADVRGRFTLYRSHFFTCPEHLVVG